MASRCVLVGFVCLVTVMLSSPRSRAESGLARAGWTIFRLDMDATGHPKGVPRPILDRDVAPSPGLRVSPDGQLIKFCSQGTGGGGMGVVGSNGESPRVFPFEGYSCGAAIDMFAWSGNDVVLYDRRTEPGAFKTMSAKTGALTTLQQLPVTVRQYSYLPETREVLIVTGGGRGAPREIHVISMLTGADRLVAKTETLDWVLATPEGNELVLAVGGEMKTMTLDGKPGRVILRAEGGTNRFRPLAVTSNGKFVLYLAITNGPPIVRQFRVLNSATGESWPLFPDDPRAWSFETSWAPDGSYIALAMNVPAATSDAALPFVPQTFARPPR